MYLIVKYKKIPHEFVVVYIKHWRLTVDELQLKYKYERNNEEYFVITNEEIGNCLRISYDIYKNTEQTIGEYFGRTIIKAHKHRIDKEIYKITHQGVAIKPLLLHQKRNQYYFETNPEAVFSQKPMEMSIQDMLLMYDIVEPFCMEKIDDFEEDFQIVFNFLRIKEWNLHNRGGQVVSYRCATLPGKSSPQWKPRFTINIGEHLLNY